MNSTGENLQNKCSNLQTRNRTGSCKEVQINILKSTPNPVKQNLQNPIQIHQKVDNPQDLNLRRSN